MARNHTIDIIKGMLMLTVIAGHALWGSLDDNIVRYIIYSFHMPLFLFISGFLTNRDKLILLSINKVWSKYWNRMIKEWSIALIVYTALLCFVNEVSLKYLVRCLVMPYYHLWYVPVLFAMIISVWFIEKHISDDLQRILLYLFVGLLLNGIYNVGYSFFAEYRFHYFSFYYLGFICKEFRISIPISAKSAGLVGLLFICLICTIYYCGINYDDYRINFLLPLNIAFCIWGILPIVRLNQLKQNLLQYIVKESLHIYLWHVLPIMVLKQLVGNTITYYMAVCFILILCIIAIKIKIKYENNKTVFDS